MDNNVNVGKYVSVSEMIEIEKESDFRGLTYQQMMENAGLGLANTIKIAYSHLGERTIFGMIGSGNNGGDALVALSHLAKHGWKATAYLVRPRPEDDPLVDDLEKNGGSIHHLANDVDYHILSNLISDHAIILDGILGTGVRLPIRGILGEFLATVRGLLEDCQDKYVVAVDCPSGVDCDSGEVPPGCIPADLTVTMAAYKQGLLKFPAYDYIGKLVLIGIGLDQLSPLPAAWVQIKRFVPDAAWISSQLPPRGLNAHKGTFGTAMIVAGSVKYTGAALLSGEAAYRVGVGLVSMAVPKSIHLALVGHLPDAIWLPLSDRDGAISGESSSLVRENLGRMTALLIGPGMGLSDAADLFIKQLLQDKLSNNNKLPPMIVDADGLKLLARQDDWMKRLPESSILTPHPGEMSILTGLSTDEIQADRIGMAEKYARSWGHIVVLKGAFTVVASPEGNCGVIPVATPALAKAGTGDVLAGLITGLRAQGVGAFQSAVIGAYIHAMAGLAAVKAFKNTASVMASDLAGFVTEILGEL